MAAEHTQPRMRVFAGPNGSGKSTVIDYIRAYTVNDQPVDFGYYINADLIAADLRTSAGHSFEPYEITINRAEFETLVAESGLLNPSFTQEDLMAVYQLRNNAICIEKTEEIERLAQMIADFLRKKLLAERKRFSFETVFSHESKLEIMQQARDAGYKVYLYFVCTESPKINVFRVEARTKKGGHNVPEDKIVTRYYRALELLHDAAQLAYQAYFFDNSDDEADFRLFAHFKVTAGQKAWDDIVQEEVPAWFKKYYSAKVKENQSDSGDKS
ncbi:MAG: putative ABC-type ATPase [Mucilaginibacter sp.]|nr:putative ABC-type ATPase [Mucilaginibacter sp.]